MPAFFIFMRIPKPSILNLLWCYIGIHWHINAGATEVNHQTASIAADVRYFLYQEINDNGTILDREEGFLPGVLFNWQNQSGAWVISGTAGCHGGNTGYSGKTNTGIPITTTTRQAIYDATLSAEYLMQHPGGQIVAPYLGLGYHRWERDILPTRTASGTPVNGLSEIYNWWLVMAGIKGGIFSSETDSLQLDIRLHQTLWPDITVNFHGNYDSAKLALGERWGGRIALPWQHKLDKETSITLELYAEYIELGRSKTSPLTSNGASAGTLFEPASQTFNSGITAWYSWMY